MGIARATAEQYAQQLYLLLPTGVAWQQRLGSVLRSLLLAIADSLARIHNKLVGLPIEADPRTTAELLDEWEATVGLPDDCITDRTLSTSERRAAVVARLVALGGASRQYFVDVAASFGYTVTITEPSLHQWQVNSEEDNVITYFRIGESTMGDSLGEFGNEQLECLLTRIKPSHTELLFAYGV